jgi:hypothetical protein
MIEEIPMTDTSATGRQLLHLVFGGELTHADSLEFLDPSRLDIVGIYPNYAEALKAWTSKSRATIDDATMRYFIVHLHRLLEPPLLTPADRT